MSFLAGLGKVVGGLARKILPSVAPKLIDAGKNLISKIPVVGGLTKSLFGWGQSEKSKTQPQGNPAVQQAPGIAQQIGAFQNQYKQGLSDAMNIFKDMRQQFRDFRNDMRNTGQGFKQQIRQEWNDARAGIRDGFGGARNHFNNEFNQARQQGRDTINQFRDMGRQMIQDTRDAGRQMRQDWRSFN